MVGNVALTGATGATEATGAAGFAVKIGLAGFYSSSSSSNIMGFFYDCRDGAG
jgi:hypothetical protein